VPWPCRVTRWSPTFHHGSDPVISDTSAPWWIEDSDAQTADIAAMRERFPGFTPFGDDGEYAYVGTIDTGRGRFQCLVLPKPDRSIPSVMPLRKSLGRSEGRRFVRAPHLYTSGRLCIVERSRGRRPRLLMLTHIPTNRPPAQPIRDGVCAALHSGSDALNLPAGRWLPGLAEDQILCVNTRYR